MRESFYHQLESFIHKRLTNLDKKYVDEQMGFNDEKMKIVSNETCEQMQKRLICLFRKIITHFIPYDDEIEK